VIFFNFRPDRARELTWALVQRDFAGFARPRVPRDLTFVTMTGFGLYAPKPEQLLESISLLFADDTRIWREMAERAASAARPYASLDIAREVLGVAERYRASEASQTAR